MSAADFFDSSVLLYLLSTDSRKADRAAELLAGGGVLSVQVLNEVLSVGTRKLGRPLAEMRQFLADVGRLCFGILPLDVQLQETGLRLMARYGFSVYDALIVGAALQANCRTLYSEDLQHGQTIEDVLTVRNPF
jgi:predicted nucleic acid-binding protein